MRILNNFYKMFQNFHSIRITVYIYIYKKIDISIFLCLLSEFSISFVQYMYDYFLPLRIFPFLLL